VVLFFLNHGWYGFLLFHHFVLDCTVFLSGNEVDAREQVTIDMMGWIEHGQAQDLPLHVPVTHLNTCDKGLFPQ